MEEKITFRCPSELAEKLRAASFALDVSSSFLIKTCITLGLPIAKEMPQFVFGVQYDPKGKGNKSE